MKIRILEPVFQVSQKKKRVCAYARVSSDSRRQEDSLENQTDTYERLITSNPEYEFAGVYADQGISGYCESRPQFQKMLGKARAGEIDLIITKSISRFARNTVTVLKVARELKELGVGIFFEEQNINTLSGDGEMMLAVLASFAQEESRSMSENNKWTIKKKFEQGEIMINTERFLGYDKDEYGGLVINQKEALVVDFLTKKRVQNQGEIQKFYIEDDHKAIIEPWIWECVQLETERRKRYLEEHGTKSYSNNIEKNPFASKIICGECNKVFSRKGWRSNTGEIRKIWQCSERYKVKGVMGCANRHIEEDTIQKIYLIAWNKLLECRDILILEWEEKMNSDDLLAKFLAKDFIEVTKEAKPMQELDIGLMLRTLDYIKVYENGIVATVFLDGTEIEYDTEVIVM